MKRTFSHYVARVIWHLLGRRNLVRMARFLGNEARLDCPNDMLANGERMAQEMLCRMFQAEPLCVFDVGANIGNWTASLCDLTRANDRNLTVHAFEPSPATYSRLADRYDSPRANCQVLCRDLALSSNIGVMPFYLGDPEAGTNSLSPSILRKSQTTEEVQTGTVDDYSRSEKITRIHFLKIDTEGQDLEVLYGAQRLLSDGKVDIVQFEYNWRWIEAKHFLREAFDLLEPLGYSLGKLTPYGVEVYPGWHFELETFKEGNYLAMKDSLLDAFPQVRWWNV